MKYRFVLCCILPLVLVFNGCGVFHSNPPHLSTWLLEEHWPESTAGRVAMAPVVAGAGLLDTVIVHPLHTLASATMGGYTLAFFFALLMSDIPIVGIPIWIICSAVGAPIAFVGTWAVYIFVPGLEPLKESYFS